MRLEVNYTSTYSYDPQVARALTALRMRPRERAGLTIERSLIRTPGARIVLSYVDGWGTQVDVVEAAQACAEEVFAVDAIVETGVEAGSDEPSAAELVMFTRDSSRVRQEAIAPLVRELSLTPRVWGSVETVVSSLPQWFTYRVGATNAETPIETVLLTREGVCQDFAHVLIGLLRTWGWAARYVSGYVYTGSRCGGRIEAEAMHAWVQVYRPEFGWIGLDPTHGGYTDDAYVPVAIGRDYDDVRPVRGVFSGGPATQSQRSLLEVTLRTMPQ